MNIEKCLKQMSMDEECKNHCSDKPIDKFGIGCNARCKANSKKAFS